MKHGCHDASSRDHNHEPFSSSCPHSNKCLRLPDEITLQFRSPSPIFSYSAKREDALRHPHVHPSWLSTFLSSPLTANIRIAIGGRQIEHAQVTWSISLASKSLGSSDWIHRYLCQGWKQNISNIGESVGPNSNQPVLIIITLLSKVRYHDPGWAAIVNVKTWNSLLPYQSRRCKICQTQRVSEERSWWERQWHCCSESCSMVNC